MDPSCRSIGIKTGRRCPPRSTARAELLSSSDDQHENRQSLWWNNGSPAADVVGLPSTARRCACSCARGAALFRRACAMGLEAHRHALQVRAIPRLEENQLSGLRAAVSSRRRADLDELADRLRAEGMTLQAIADRLCAG